MNVDSGISERLGVLEQSFIAFEDEISGRQAHDKHGVVEEETTPDTPMRSSNPCELLSYEQYKLDMVLLTCWVDERGYGTLAQPNSPPFLPSSEVLREE